MKNNSDFEKSNKYYCPNCGSNEQVYKQPGVGDYYLDSLYICKNCKSDFYPETSSEKGLGYYANL